MNIDVGDDLFHEKGIPRKCFLVLKRAREGLFTKSPSRINTQYSTLRTC